MGAHARAEEPNCSVVEVNFTSSLSEFNSAKGQFCEASKKCGQDFGEAGNSSYDNCVASSRRELDETAKILTAWELARCEAPPPEDDLYYLCGSNDLEEKELKDYKISPALSNSVANR